MPELPDLEIYAESIAQRAVQRRLDGLSIANPFLLRTVAPGPADFTGRQLQAVFRIGKRIVLEFEDQHFAVIHLMVAGRFKWIEKGTKGVFAKNLLARFEFETGSLGLTEAGSKRRASLHLVKGSAALAALDPGGLEPLGMSLNQFSKLLLAENHTLKRALTNPAFISGIGNAYSDEILHRAKLSPLKLTQSLNDGELPRLFAAMQDVLREWTQMLRNEARGRFPEKVTAFRPEFAVHGKFGAPCPDCGAPVQRIVYAENESNYCARCQTGGKLLADRALSRLLKSSWPKTIDG